MVLQGQQHELELRCPESLADSPLGPLTGEASQSLGLRFGCCVVSFPRMIMLHLPKTWMFIDPESTKGNCNELWAWECCESPEWQQIKDSAIESTCANVRNPACQCSRCKTCFPKAPTTLTWLVTQTKSRSLLYVDYDCTHLYPTDFERCADKHAVATWLEKGVQQGMSWGKPGFFGDSTGQSGYTSKVGKAHCTAAAFFQWKI